MNQYLVKVAELFGLSLANFTTESSLQEAITLKFNEMKNKPADPTVPPAPAVNEEVADLKSKLDTIEAERVAELVDSAIKDFKILPAQKEEFMSLGKVNYNILKTTVANMTTHKDLADKVVKPIEAGNMVDLTAGKFKKADGKPITYLEYLKLTAKEQANFTAEEVKELRKTW